MSADGVIHDKVIRVSDFMEYLKSEGYVIAPRSVKDQMMVKNIPIETYRNRILRKNLLSALEISNGQVWGPIGKAAVKKIIKNRVPEDSQVTIGSQGTIKIPLKMVKSIAIDRGYSWG